MKSVDKILINKKYTIKQALKVISEGSFQVALVINHKKRLIGTLTDGDIRSALLKGKNLGDSIDSVFFKKPKTVKEGSSHESLLKIAFSNKIHQIPVLDGKGRPVGIHILDELIEDKKKSCFFVILAPLLSYFYI